MAIYNIRLRRLVRSDAPAIRAALDDGFVAKYVSRVPHPYPEGEEYKWGWHRRLGFIV